MGFQLKSSRKPKNRKNNQIEDPNPFGLPRLGSAIPFLFCMFVCFVAFLGFSGQIDFSQKLQKPKTIKIANLIPEDVPSLGFAILCLFVFVEALMLTSFQLCTFSSVTSFQKKPLIPYELGLLWGPSAPVGPLRPPSFPRIESRVAQTRKRNHRHCQLLVLFLTWPIVGWPSR